jgi:AcrR family transcriptional regulator
MSAPAPPKRGRPALDHDEVARLRTSIIDAATVAFASRGATATTIDDVARAAGVSRATVYRYAGGRDDLIVQVALRRFDEWVDGVVSHAARFDTVADIVTEAVVWTARTVEHDPTLGALFAAGTATAASNVLTKRSSHSATSTWHTRFGDLLRTRADELRRGLDAGDVADHVLTVLLDELVRPHHRSERELRDNLARWVLPALLEVRPPLPSPSPASVPPPTSALPTTSTQAPVA